MKRSPLKRSKGLSRTSRPSSGPPKAKPRKPLGNAEQLRARLSARIDEPGRAEWKQPRSGRCGVCGARGPLLRHHVLLEQMVRVAHGDPWDLANSMDVGARCACHRRHHDGGAGRIPLDLVPPAAVAFTQRVLGPGPAENYFNRRYNPTRVRGTHVRD